MSTDLPYTSHGLLPGALQGETPTAAQIAPRYQRLPGTDPERMSGTQVHYARFDDFIATLADEAANPKVVGAADILDIINPLQHLPLVSTLYRDITGDQIKPGARIMGGAVFGGGVGLASSSVNAVIEAETGTDLAGNMALAVSGHAAFVSKAPEINDDPNILAMGLQGDQAGAAKPEHVEISWNNPLSKTQGRSPQHVASAYARADAAYMLKEQMISDIYGPVRPVPVAANTTKPFEVVTMTDRERTAGSFARYV